MVETLGKYELRQVLGRGAMGTVYEGYDPIIHRKLAIKTVRLPDAEDADAQEELARFKREAQAAGRLGHPNIVGVFDYGETAELAYMVMEFVDGTTLKHVIDKKERFELAEIVRLMDGLMAGLQYSHDRGVVHRDIKPANLMLTPAGEVKIADFGIARIESSSMTQAGTMLGTPSYMSPEQFMGQTVDARTDIYSSGVMLYQLLTGEKPFEGGLTAIMHKVLHTEPPPPSALSVTVPPAFDAVVKKAMAKRPEDRFASAGAFAAAVRQALSARDETSSFSLGADDYGDGEATMVAPRRAAPPPLAPPQPVQAPARRRPPLLLGGIGLAVLLAAGGGGYLLFSGGKQSPSNPAKTVPAPTLAKSAPAPAPVSLAQRQAALSATLGSLPCTLLSMSGNRLEGLAGAGAPQAALTAALGSLPPPMAPVSDVITTDGPYCNALDAIRPYHPLFAAGSSLAVELAGGQTSLHNGDLITIAETMPNFSGYLTTDYFSSDGSVSHLYPPAGTTTAEPAGEQKVLGKDPAHGLPGWKVSAPFGADMIVSIVSSAPLFSAPPTGQTGDSYLPALRQALQTAASAGARISVAAAPVTTLAQ